MTPNDEGLTFSSLSYSNVTLLDEGLTFTPSNCFHFILRKKKTITFFLIIKCRFELPFIDFYIMIIVNLLFKFHENDDETI